jgi:hypothetical protein
LPPKTIRALAEVPPPRLDLIEVGDLLSWYERNLCSQKIIDPRGHEIRFNPERFPHLIKLLEPNSTAEVKKPQKEVDLIRAGKKTNADFGGFDKERAATLTWIPAMVLRPTQIKELRELYKPGDNQYIKEFNKWGYKYKVLICRRVGEKLLVPVTCHPKEKISKGGLVVWPLDEPSKQTADAAKATD